MKVALLLDHAGFELSRIQYISFEAREASKELTPMLALRKVELSHQMAAWLLARNYLKC